ncbi:MAG: VWA domain-containing protein [Mycobacterium sp.]
MSLQPAIPWWLLATLALLVVAVLVLLKQRRYVLLIAAVLLLAAATRPVIGGSEPTVMRVAGERAPNVFVIVDRSADMSVPDGSGRSRMDTARDDIGALVERYPEARFAVISFDSRPSLDWPLSADTWSLRQALAAAMPYARTAEDTTNAGAASNVLRYQLIGARGQYPQARNLVYYLGAGAPGSTVRQREFRVPDNAIDGGAVKTNRTRSHPMMHSRAGRWRSSRRRDSSCTGRRRVAPYCSSSSSSTTRCAICAAPASTGSRSADEHQKTPAGVLRTGGTGGHASGGEAGFGRRGGHLCGVAFLRR